MKEPFHLVKRCEKDGRRHRCATYPTCACDWYDRPRQGDGTRPWVHLPETAHSKQLAYRLAGKKRQDAVQIAEGLKAKPKPPTPLLSAYITTYLNTADVRTQKTPVKTAKNLADFLAHVQDRRLEAVTGAMIDDWRVALHQRRSKKTGGTWSRNTVQRVYNSVKGLFSHALVDEALEPCELKNPCDKLTDWSDDPAPRRLWHPSEQWLIGLLPPLFSLPLEIGFHCGCRRTEALLVTKHDLSPKGFAFPGVRPKLGWIALQRKKKRIGMVKVRIPIAVAILEKLRKQLTTPFQLHIFGDPPPDPNTWSSLLTRELRKLGEAHDVDTRGLCMHGTRHTATTTMQDMPGVSTQTAKNMGGWTSTRMVETYSSPAEASMQAAAAGLAKTWRPRRPKVVGVATKAGARGSK